jgi:ABC-type polysaccharide/polyol phosphate transport system ATPase subunit
MPIIEVSHLTKEYQLGHITSLKENVFNTFRRLGRKPVQKREDFKALDDVNFAIEEGEVVGIIGHNGSGKSTLLKHLANISKPTKGKVIVNGSVAPLIEVGAGVNPELTGRENIFLNGAILGIPKKIIQQKLDEIIDFSELEQFIDTPVKRYSSGMTVKLGFSIATSLDADILIVDEVLAVGDLAFQRKCFDKMEDMIKRQGKTVLLVSHNIRQVERLCPKVILMDHGRIAAIGDAIQVCNQFYKQSDDKIHKQLASANNSSLMREGVDIVSVRIADALGNGIEELDFQDDLYIHINYLVHKRIEKPVFGIGFHTTDFIYLASRDSLNFFFNAPLDLGNHHIVCKVASFPFNPGVYALRLGIADGEVMVSYGENIIPICVTSKDQSLSYVKEAGFVPLDVSWQVNPESVN